MDAAKRAIAEFTGRKGHTTEVEEVVNPAVTSETIKPTRHENVTSAIDREVHQHHYHTTVQPITHQEVLPEKHVHNVIPVENREFRHENHDETKHRVSTDLARFKDSSITHDTKHTQAVAPSVTGEHVHHHVHETVQPIIHKETVQPEVVHTTVPIHETHHAVSTHHGLSALPMKTLDEFKKMGGVLHGNTQTTHENYEGPPREYNKDLSTTFDKLGLGSLGHHHSGTTGTTGTTGATGTPRTTDSGVGLGHHSGTGTTGVTGTQRTTDSGPGLGHHSGTTGTTGTTGTRGTTGGLTGEPHSTSTTAGGTTTNTTTSTSTTATGPHSSSIANKLDPRVDSDRDGKKGLMS